jgi:hypothetical protein
MRTFGARWYPIIVVAPGALDLDFAGLGQRANEILYAAEFDAQLGGQDRLGRPAFLIFAAKAKQDLQEHFRTRG